MGWFLYDIGLRHERVKQFVMHIVISCKMLLIWELEWDYKRHEIINEIRWLELFLHTFILTFIWSRDVFQLVRARWDPACPRWDSGINVDNIFHVNIRPIRKNVPPQHFFYECNYKKRFCLLNALNETANQSLLKKHSPSQSLWIY